MKAKTIVFSNEAQRALDLVQSSSKNLFITGKAGTGKSTLLEHIVSQFGKDMVVLAPTGIAAINVKGETLHSFFRLKPGYELDEAKHMRISKRRADKYKFLKTILIDEISMVRADILDAVDIFLQRVRANKKPFGGVRMIFFGDLFQLPPVVTSDEQESFYQMYKSPWFFSAHLFLQRDLFNKGFSMEKIELTKIYRQSDQEFIQKLNAIRTGQIASEELTYFDQFVRPDFVPSKNENRVYLVATNAQAQSINRAKLQQIDRPIEEFKASREGKIGKIQPNDEQLWLKAGAQVMMINNDSEKRWVNGSIGSIQSVGTKVKEGNRIKVLNVLLESGKIVTVEPHTWPISKYQFKKGKFVREEIGTFTQMPLKLAWAFTIHKSQGKSFQKIVLDLGNGGFAHGQCYVALSRCVSPQGLVLKRAIRLTDMIVDREIKSLTQSISTQQEHKALQ